jgi:hypothetical protein
MSDFKIDRARWAELDIFQQMGNIGAEVGRAINARRTGKEERVLGAITRALDLFSATTEQLVKEKSPRLKEVLRARNEFLRLFYDGTFEEEADSIERYFTQFALVARKNMMRTEPEQ